MTVVAVKALHVAALVVWCAGLLALPFLLRVHRTLLRGGAAQADFTRTRLLTHTLYTRYATPSAVVAIAAGTGLVFLERVTDPWLVAKLTFVAGMVLVHAWLGHLVLKAGERPEWRMPQPMVALLLLLPLMAAILLLVLAKPPLHRVEALLPEAVLSPRGVDLGALLRKTALQETGP